MICNKVDLAKSRNISISKTTNYSIHTSSEYSLTQNLFDPFQSSPPNDFLQKLHQRMQIHEQKLNKCS